MTPAQRQSITHVGRRPRRGPIALLLLAALAAWVWAWREVRAMEQAIRRAEPEATVVIQPSARLAEDVAACHRRLDLIDATIVAIEARRGQDPPRTLIEARRYRAAGWDNSAPSTYAPAPSAGLHSGDGPTQPATASPEQIGVGYGRRSEAVLGHETATDPRVDPKNGNARPDRRGAGTPPAKGWENTP